eukprot:COSAG02_NODE_23250_length_725_cov_0.653355_1_plen_138_part_00
MGVSKVHCKVHVSDVWSSFALLQLRPLWCFVDCREVAHVGLDVVNFDWCQRDGPVHRPVRVGEGIVRRAPRKVTREVVARVTVLVAYEVALASLRLLMPFCSNGVDDGWQPGVLALLRFLVLLCALFLAGHRVASRG